jgi:hypothetical protein
MPTTLPGPLVLPTGPPEILSKKILSKIEREMSEKRDDGGTHFRQHMH